MKPVLRQITDMPEHSFLVRKDIGSQMMNNWHYHPELEILYIKKSSGTWMIGDHIGHFNSGDVVMIGANLPHCFRHEYDYVLQTAVEAGESICIKFKADMLGQPFLALPEAREIKELFKRCSCGLKLTGKTRQHIARIVEKTYDATPGRRLAYLVWVLEEIAVSRSYITLSSQGFMQTPGDEDQQKIRKIFEYTFSNYHNKIRIEDVAGLLNMTRQSFCRYFKSKTKKTYVQFLMEVRIGYACRLLIEDEKNVSEISYDAGYNNISHFIHQFKTITGKTPLEYKRDYMRVNPAS
jgi:AraC-like DNA-binding protein